MGAGRTGSGAVARGFRHGPFWHRIDPGRSSLLKPPTARLSSNTPSLHPASVCPRSREMSKPEFISAEIGTRLTAHALHVGDRINTVGFEAEALSAMPLAIRAGKAGVAVL